MSFSSSAAQMVQVDIPAGDGEKSLLEFARQSGVDVIAPGSQLHGVMLPAVKGTYDVQVALELMLKGTDLTVSRTLEGGIMVSFKENQSICNREGETMNNKSRLAAHVSWLVMALASLQCAVAQGSSSTGPDVLETVVVTGYRASLQGALDAKRTSAEMIDAINAEDIANFPDANLAEALQRLPGVAIDRENGEGRTITVRGLGPNFTRVTLNGLQSLSTAGGNGAGVSPNRDRGFDFNTFASELFGSLRVQKSAAAATEEGSLGATVDLSTPHPFDMGGKDRFVLGAQNAWYEIGKTFNPRVTALASKTFFGGKIGVLASVAYNSKSVATDSYARGVGSADYVYRGMLFANSTPTGLDNSSLMMRNGFAAPSAAVCDGTVAPYTNGVIPGNNITNTAYCNLLRGSDPTAYAAVNSPQGWTTTDTNPKVGSITSLVTAPGSVTRFPSNIGFSHQEIFQSKLGMTGAIQWQVDDSMLVTVDGLFSQVYQRSRSWSIGQDGLNRNNTSSILNTATAATADSALRGMFITCASQPAANPSTGLPQAAIDCGDTQSGATIVPGTQFSYNPKNLDVYDYYTSAYSAANYLPGASKQTALNTAYALVGRPSIKLKDAKVVDGNVTYMALDNIDMATWTDDSWYATQFEQLSVNVTKEVSSKFHVNATAGWSRSYNHQDGLFVSQNSMDLGTTKGDGLYVYDATGGGEMPKVNFGFDTNDPARWTFIKGFSTLRRYVYYTKNSYRTLIANAAYDLTDQFTLRAGVNIRFFDFNTAYFTKVYRDQLAPSFAELGVTTSQMSRLVTWGRGLDYPSGTTTSWLAPDMDKYRKASGFDCNCVNQYGDWRLWNLYSVNNSSLAGQTYGVSEHSKSYFGQLDFNEIVVFGNSLRGNVGSRFVVTDVIAKGHALAGQEVQDTNHYTDFLPAANLIYNLSDTMLVRIAGAKVMARAGLGNMAPSITGYSPPSSGTRDLGSTGTMTLGNTHLKPYRANTFDFGWEWYFDRGSLIAVSAFAKWVKDTPQQVITNGAIKDILPASTIQILHDQYAAACGATDLPTNAACNTLWYIDNNYTTSATMPLNGPGGSLKGVEITYQQPLEFIPAFMGGQGFGINANYTKITSKMHYIIYSTTKGQTFGDGPWTGTSPDAFNFTTYYDGQDWSGRISAAFRSKYVTTYPIASGGDIVGFGNSPMINEFGYGKNTLNVDAAFSYNLNESIQMTLDVLNLTGQADRRFAYSDAPVTTNYASNGRQVYLGFRFKY